MIANELVLVDAKAIYDEVGKGEDFSEWFKEKRKSAKLVETEDFIAYSKDKKTAVSIKAPDFDESKVIYLLTERATKSVSDGEVEIKVRIITEHKRKRVQKLLSNWSSMDEEIDEVIQQISELRAEIDSIPEPDGIEYREGLKSSKIADETFQKANRIEHLNKHLMMLMDKHKQLEDDYIKLYKALYKLGYRERLLMQGRYLKNQQWYNIAKEIDISEANCKRFHNEVLTEFMYEFDE